MTMDARLQAWLDGDVELDDLPDELRERAAAWTEVLEDVRAMPAPGAAPDATSRVMAAVRADAGSSGSALARARDGLAWLVRPRPIRLSPLLAAAVVVLAIWSGVRLVGGGTGPGADGRVYVQFVIAAPNARSVALAGDFNEWSPSIELSDPDMDGVWSARVALEAGVHEYMFVIDGTEWRPDPNALSYTADGFGRRNSVVAVAPLDRT
ncbi:MAG: isoamylase early set domain-containing protein [Gemmatimonadales bacterium]|jgi:hypothetical protein